MIRSFACADTEELFHSVAVRRFRQIESVARRKLLQLDAAPRLEDMRGFHLETVSKPLKATVRGNTAFVSTTSGVFVLSGQTTAFMALKLWITIERGHHGQETAS